MAASFGEAGPYLRIHGVAKGELDPAAPENEVIVDLDKAQRNARGKVEYETDFFILRPAEPQRGSGVLVYDVTNRGRKVILGRLDEAGGRRRHQQSARGAGAGSASPSAAATASSGPAGMSGRRASTTA